MKKVMKKIIFAVFTATMLLLGAAGCSSDDSSSSVDINALEKSFVGLWWDEFEYSDVTDEGEPFNRVLLAIKAEADHTGCIYLAVFNDTGRQPLAVYGGPKEAGFTWRMLDDGRLELSELITSDSTAQSRGADASGSYAEGMTDVANTSVNYSDGNMTVTNGSDSRKLAKADDAKRAEIVKLLFTLSPATNLTSEDSIKINVNPVDSGFWGR